METVTWIKGRSLANHYRRAPHLRKLETCNLQPETDLSTLTIQST